MIYLDNNATTPVTPEVMKAMIPYFCEKFLNPGSFAGELDGVDKILTQTKQALANYLGGTSSEFVFTSGATESNNWVLRSLARKHLIQDGSFNLVISSTEHPSVLETAKDLELLRGVNLSVLDVNEQGEIPVEQITEKVTPETHLVSVILANNESGVIADIKGIASQVKALSPHCLLHTDATQAVRKIPIDLNGELQGVDLLSLSAHKFHGPKGIGALFIRNGVHLPAFITGGGQQDGLRSGTENSALAAGMMTALSLSYGHNNYVESLRDEFEKRLVQEVPDTQVLAQGTRRLPNTSMLVLPHLEGEMAVSMLHQYGVIVSTGSACSSGADKPSHVATAMGIPFTDARNTLRVSFSNWNTKAELDDIIQAFKMIVFLNSE